MDTFPAFKVLYVCDIDHLVEEEDLWRAFAPWGHGIISIRLIKDIKRFTGTSHAFVNFNNNADALMAYNSVQPLFLSSSYCRVSPYDGKTLQKPPRIDQINGGGIFIKNLDTQVGPAALWGYFMGFGNILGCRIAIDDFGFSRKFAYVTYEKPEEAEAAIAAMNGQVIGGLQIRVSHNHPKNQRETRVFIKIGDIEKPKDNGKFPLTEEQIREALDVYGPVSSVVLPQLDSGKPKNFAFAMFPASGNPEQAIKEVTQIAEIPVQLKYATGSYRFTHHEGGPWENPARRNLIPGHSNVPAVYPIIDPVAKSMAEARLPAPASHPPVKRGNNLFVRPLYNNVSEQELREEFSKYGQVVDSKLMYFENGNSRGYGFIKYETAEEAARATEKLNGKVKWGNELCVAPAQTRHRKIPRAVPLTPTVMYPSPRPATAGLYDQEIPLPAMYAPGVYHPGAYPGFGMYYVPMEYSYDYTYGNGSQRSDLEYSSVDSDDLGEALIVRVLKHPSVDGNQDLASVITGLLLQQKQSDILYWLENEVILKKRIQQAYDAYRNWLDSQSNKS